MTAKHHAHRMRGVDTVAPDMTFRGNMMDALHTIGLSTARESIDRASSILSQALAGRDQSVPGLSEARLAKAMMLQRKHGGTVQDIAARRWGAASAACRITKDAVPAGGAGSLLIQDAQHAPLELVALADKLTARGRLRDTRRIPPNTPGITIAGGATGFFVGEAAAIPVSGHVFDREILRSKKEGAIIVLSNEAMESSDPAVEELFRVDLIRALADVDDLVFLSDDVGTSATPAGVAASLESPASISSSGDIAADVEAALAAFAGNLLSSSWIMHPKLAARIGLLSGGIGIGAGTHALGGQLAGIEVLTSQQSPDNQLLLIDGSGLLHVDEGIEFSSSSKALIEMDTDPQGEGFSPTGASANLVSMFQNDLHALKLVRRVNWRMARHGGVIVISGATYAGS